MKIKVKQLPHSVGLPKRATDGAAGFDLCAAQTESHWLHAGGVAFVPTGLCFEIPPGYVGLIFPRSGTASKKQLTLANCVGVIDSDYRGEVMIPLLNTTTHHNRGWQPAERLAQIVFMPIPHIELELVDELSDTERGEGGFGSTGRDYATCIEGSGGYPE